MNRTALSVVLLMSACAHLSSGNSGNQLQIHASNPEFIGGRVALLVGDSLQDESELTARPKTLRFQLSPGRGYTIVAQQNEPINTSHYTFQVRVVLNLEDMLMIDLALAQPCGKPVLIIRQRSRPGSIRAYTEEEGAC